MITVGKMAPDFSAIKQRQQATWASGDFAVVGVTLQIVGEMLAESADICAGEREHVADVEPLGRGIRKHHEVVERPARVIDVGLVGVPLRPAQLPGGLDDRGIVNRCVRHKCLKLNGLARP